jgi:hypothetical protein
MSEWLRRKWTVLTLLVCAWVLFTVTYAIMFVTIPAESTRLFETVKFVALSVSAFGVLFSALLSSFNSLEATANVQDRIQFDRVENSFEFVRRWDSAVLKEARDWTRRVKKEEQSLSPDDLRSKIRSDETLERSVITMFNFFEELELSVQQNRVDAKVLERAFATTYRSIHQRFSPWIESNIDAVQKGHLQQLRNRWR